MLDEADLDGLSVKDMVIGETQRVNHARCPAGSDRRQRLYVLRKSDDLWLLFCHNCGEGNALWSKRAGLTKQEVLDRLLKHYTPEEVDIPDHMVKTTSVSCLPPDGHADHARWDAWVHERLWKFHMNAMGVVIPPYNWTFSPSLNQLITPIYDSTKVEVGFQARLHPDRKPKCITTYYAGKKGVPLFYEGAGSYLFIVEDPLSALRIHLCTGHHAVALLGTHLSDPALVELIHFVSRNSVANIVIWFDDDTAGKEASVKVYNRLSKLYYVSHMKVMQHTYLEPKEVLDLKGYVEEWTSRFSPF